MINWLAVFAILAGLLLGIFIGIATDKQRAKEIGTITIDPSNVEEGLFSIQFSDDPLQAKDGEWIRFKVVRK